MRFERKFLIPQYLKKTFIFKIKSSPFFFKERYETRTVNNIYFDTRDLDCFFKHLYGHLQRSKFRIRWYNNYYNQPTKYVFEVKKKNNLLGEKIITELGTHSCTSINQINNLLSKNNNTKFIQQLVFPKLKNSYNRLYLSNFGDSIRITIDDNLTYHSFQKSKTLVDKKNLIIELKYEKQNHILAVDLFKFLNIRQIKFSKYIYGMLKTRPELNYE